MTSCSELPLWFACVFEIFAKITPVIITGLVAYVAWQQWQTAKQQSQTAQSKLRLDLYNRRFVIYENTLAFYQTLLDGKDAYRTENFERIHLKFITSLRESKFLFDQESGIFQLLDELNKASFKITAIYGMSDHKPIYPQAFEAHTAAMQKLDGLIESLEKLMSPYLNFHKI